MATIIKIISEHKKKHGHKRFNPQGMEIGTLGYPYGKDYTVAPKGMKRVMAIVKEDGREVTRHLNVAA